VFEVVGKLATWTTEPGGDQLEIIREAPDAKGLFFIVRVEHVHRVQRPVLVRSAGDLVEVKFGTKRRLGFTHEVFTDSCEVLEPENSGHAPIMPDARYQK